MIITVTQEDIDEGSRMSCEQCPVALAILRSIPTLTSVGWKMFFYKKETVITDIRANATRINVQTLSVILPVKATNFIEDFDEGKEVKPFNFEVEV